MQSREGGGGEGVQEQVTGFSRKWQDYMRKWQGYIMKW